MYVLNALGTENSAVIHFVDSAGNIRSFSPKGFAAVSEDVQLRTHNDRSMVRDHDGHVRDVTPMGATS